MYINMARAAVVDYGALAQKLTRGELAGAILDVFDPEPLPSDSPLWDCQNLLITPHVSADALNRNVLLLREFADNFRRFISGRPLRNQIETTRQY
jgi:phosphoglycerate dehydrogenase-like enzyme